MSIFKNPNEEAYAGGRKHWTDIIKNSGDGSLLVWRQPEEDFNTNSTLIVMPGEAAVFIKDGHIEQTFNEGRYQLSTKNYPFISRLRNAFSGGISTFNCVVYFIRKAHSMELRWGTDSPIQVRDKLLGIATKVRARGVYKVQVANATVLLPKLLGNNVPWQRQEDLDAYFAGQFQSRIKAFLTDELNNMEAELIGIEARLEELSQRLMPRFAELLRPYGLHCIAFAISALDIDDDALRRKYDEIGMEAIEKLRIAQAEKAVIGTLGEDWTRVQSANILRDLANNPGAGGVAAMGAGLVMGGSAGGAFDSMAKQMCTPSQDTGNPSGGETPAAGEDPVAKMQQLKAMLDMGAITQKEFDKKKAEILKSI